MGMAILDSQRNMILRVPDCIYMIFHVTVRGDMFLVAKGHSGKQYTVPCIPKGDRMKHASRWL